MKNTNSNVLSRIPSGVWVLGFVSLLMDISSEMIHSLLPLLMVVVLGTSVLAVGLIEGLAESTALIVKVFSGVLNGYLGKRKGLALFGYVLGALTKPLFALASGAGIVLAARFLGRVARGYAVHHAMHWLLTSRRPRYAVRRLVCANHPTQWARFSGRCWRSA